MEGLQALFKKSQYVCSVRQNEQLHFLPKTTSIRGAIFQAIPKTQSVNFYSFLWLWNNKDQKIKLK